MSAPVPAAAANGRIEFEHSVLVRPGLLIHHNITFCLTCSMGSARTSLPALTILADPRVHTSDATIVVFNENIGILYQRSLLGSYWGLLFSVTKDVAKREREKTLYLSSHNRLMQVLPGHPCQLADPRVHTSDATIVVFNENIGKRARIW